MKRNSVLNKYATVLSSGRKGKPPSTSGRSRSWQALFATAAIAVFAGAGHAQLVSGTNDASHGFPLYYQDGSPSKTQLEACLDTRSGACVLLPDPGFDPNKVLNFPGNFPSEFFYYVVDSDKIPTPGCPASNGLPAVAPGLAKYRAAIEGTFLNGFVQPGQQITFGRTKIVASGLCPNATYTFTHPYGKDTITTDSQGQVVANKKGGTIDVGCGATPCDFSVASTSRVLTGFLTSTATKPSGYLGDGATLAPVTGSPLGTNFYTITGPNLKGGLTTNNFTVSGRVAGPLMVSPPAEDFGVVNDGSSLAKTLSVTNITSSPLNVGTPAVVGSDFASDNGCVGVNLAPGGNCTVTITFTPSTAGDERAQLQVGTRSIDLGGTGASSAPSVSVSTQSLDFGSMRVHGTTAPQTVTVTNTSASNSNSNLGITASLMQMSPFGIATDTCTGRVIPPGGTCSVGVTFSPTVGTTTNPVLASTSLLLADNASGSPQTVALSGTGTGGVSAVSPSTNQYGFPVYYQDENARQLQPCINGSDPNCVLLPEPGFNPAAPLAFGSGVTSINFPSEAFYMVADSDKLNTPGCPTQNIAPGTAKYRAAIEEAFLNGPVKWGDQITFARTKIVADGLCPNTDYYFTHPYGKDLITTNDLGQVVANKKGGTIDTGCGGTPCDFSVALGGRVLGGFLQWDPAVAPAAPTGHLGDGGVGTLHVITGSPFTDPLTGQPANLFRVSDAKNTTLAETNLFTVAGLLYPTVTAPAQPAPTGPETINITLAQFRNDQLRWTVSGTDSLIANQSLTIKWNGTTLGTAIVTTTGAWNFDIRGVAANLVPKAGDQVSVSAPSPSKATASAKVSIK